MPVPHATRSHGPSMVRVNVCARGHRIYDIDCGSCRVLNPNPRRRPSGLRGRHLGPVAERDRHQCQLCGEPVDLTLTPPHPQSATLDHVIPRAHGGSDHRDNLQLAHLDCNQAKADTLITALGEDVQFPSRRGSW